MSIIIRVLIFLLLPSLCFAKNVYEYHFTNGLQLLVKEDHRAHVVISEVWYKVGSSYEPDGITGISHVLEHMMFRGTPTYPNGAFTRIIAENGGQQNAFTAYDFTAYYQLLNADKLATSFKLEADRMRHLSLKPEDFAREIQVVMEERRMRVDDNPQSLALERYMAAAFLSNPYHHMTIGWMSDLQNMTCDDVRQWYQQWYGPNNAIIVVVGDVNPQNVYALAKRYFSSLKPIKLPTIKPHPEVSSLGIRELSVKVPAQVPWLIMGYNVPVVKTAKQAWEPYALFVLNGILSQGDSSRLDSRLVRGQQIAAEADTNYDPFSRLDNVFTFSATPNQGYSLQQLKTALLAQIKLLQEQPVSLAELERVKAQLIAYKIYSKDDISNQAYELGSLAAVGLPWQLSDTLIAEVNKITPQQVQAVAQKYFTPDKIIVTYLNPLPLAKNNIAPARNPGVEHVQ